jgi:hypothetical protein
MTEPPHTARYLRIGAHNVLVLVPTASERPYPILTFLHGRGEAAGDAHGHALSRQDAEAVLRRHGPPSMAGPPMVRGTEPGDGPVPHDFARFLVICPQLPRVRQWQEADADWVVPIEDELATRHHGDPGRRHLTGFSWGGAGVTRFAGRRDLAGRWLTAWLVDPNPDLSVTPLPPEDIPAMLHFGTYFDRSVMIAWRSSAGFDGNFRSDAARAEKELAAGHVETARFAYRDACAYRWLAHWEGARPVGA